MLAKLSCVSFFIMKCFLDKLSGVRFSTQFVSRLFSKKFGGSKRIHTLISKVYFVNRVLCQWGISLLEVYVVLKARYLQYISGNISHWRLQPILWCGEPKKVSREVAGSYSEGTAGIFIMVFVVLGVHAPSAPFARNSPVLRAILDGCHLSCMLQMLELFARFITNLI